MGLHSFISTFIVARTSGSTFQRTNILQSWSNALGGSKIGYITSGKFVLRGDGWEKSGELLRPPVLVPTRILNVVEILDPAENNSWSSGTCVVGSPPVSSADYSATG